MKYAIRRLRRYFGMASRSVAVRTALPWYGLLGWRVGLVLLGYLIGYMQYSSGDVARLREQINKLALENRNMRTQSIHMESQRQVNQIVQGDLAKELALLQEENGKLKEDVGFYKNILEDRSSVEALKLHSFKVNKSARMGIYNFRLLLTQSGRHDKNVQCSLQLFLIGTQEGKSVALPVDIGAGARDLKINFKYYQSVEGSFSVPQGASINSVLAKVYMSGSAEPRLTQSAALPQFKE